MKIKSFLVAAILLSAVFCVTSGALAMTAQERQTLIAQIRAQIDQLLAQVQILRSQQGTTAAWCHTFNTDLDMLSTGSEVAALQTALQKEGFSIASSELNSQTFASSTGQAVINFKTKYRSQIVTAMTTKVSDKTNGMLNRIYGCAAEPATTPTPALICSNLYWFDNTSSNQCQAQKQFCGAYMYYGLQTFDNKQDCLNAFNADRISCTRIGNAIGAVRKWLSVANCCWLQ